MANLTPPLHAKGLYTLSSPWQLPPGVVYECIAIRSFNDFVDKGVDVVSKVYTPVGLTSAEADADREAGANIITLVSGTRPMVFVPDSYIESFPALDGVPFSQTILSVSLGAIPDDFNLMHVQQEVSAAVTAALGITPIVKISRAPSTNYVTPEQRELWDVGREAAVTNRDTPEAQLLVQNDVIQRQAAQIATLEGIVIAAGLVQ